MDPIGELRGLAECLLHVASQLVECHLRPLGIRLHPAGGELEVDRERHEVLLHAPVQLPLERPAVGVGGEDDPLARRTQRRDLLAELVERRVGRIGVHE